MEIRMRQFIKYLIFSTNIFLLLFTFYECYNIAGWYKLIPLVIVILHLLVIIKLIDPKSKNRYVIIYPQLGKKIKHESGDYYVIDSIDKEYRLYKDYIFYMENLHSISHRYIENASDLARNFKSSLDDLYQIKIQRKKRKEILKNWDGYLCEQSKRDDKINQVIK
jgi:hypothetical protein